MSNSSVPSYYVKNNIEKQFNMNILVESEYGEGSLLTAIRECVHRDEFVVYPISQQLLRGTTSWSSNCRLLVLQDDPQPDVEEKLTEFRTCGGSWVKLNNTDKESILKTLKNQNINLNCQIDCGTVEEENTGSFLSRSHSDLLEHSSILARKSEDCLEQRSVVLKFCENSHLQKAPTGIYKKTLVLKVCQTCGQFNFDAYCTRLATKVIGHNILHFPTLSSSMTVLDGPPLIDGLVVVPDTQTAGQGRSANAWISPRGCAMFSLQLHLGAESNLGKRPTLIQHLVGLAVCRALRLFQPDFDVRLKWPNDIYYKDKVKLGGVIVNSSFNGRSLVANIGCGLNLDNSAPTMSINQILEKYYTDNSGDCDSSVRLSREEYLANMFNSLEWLISRYNEGLEEEVYKLYYESWLHTDQQIVVLNGHSRPPDLHSLHEKVRIVGLDEYGYLRVENANGDQFSVMDDGNSFDMTKGLIRPKFS